MNDNNRPATVLVVDDEPEVRKLVAAVIGNLGYEVHTADTGEHALAIHEHLGSKIDLLVADVISPGMSGPLLAQRLAARQPDLKVLYISGYDHTHVVQAYVLDRGCSLITKPFSTGQLAEAVRAMIHGAHRANGAGK
jgi:CheY-like chemotaxis protein